MQEKRQEFLTWDHSHQSGRHHIDADRESLNQCILEVLLPRSWRQQEKQTLKIGQISDLTPKKLRRSDFKLTQKESYLQ